MSLTNKHKQGSTRICVGNGHEGDSWRIPLTYTNGSKAVAAAKNLYFDVW